MNHNDESYATMLLSVNISPDREELVTPFTAQEWHAFRGRLRARNMRMSDLIGMDMSALMMRLELNEEEAYRVFLLLSRMLPLSISLEKLAIRGVDVVTYAQKDYPEELRRRLMDSAPPVLYLSGRPELFKQDAIAILGAVNPCGKSVNEVEKLVEMAVGAGYVIVTDGTMGLSEVARKKAIDCGGKTVEVLPGGMTDRVDQTEMTALIARGDVAIVSMEHPEKPSTPVNAQSRNKIVYGLSRAAFVIGVEKNRGAVWPGACEAIKKRWCSRVYAWETDVYEDNAELIKRGAQPFTEITPELFSSMRFVWQNDASRQVCMFDNEDPL